MTAGNLASWKLAEGSKINVGDVIAEVETDKATVDYEAQDEGYLARILVPEGATDVIVGTTVAVVVEEEADIAAFKDYTAAAAAAPEPAAPAAAVPAASAPAPAATAAAAPPSLPPTPPGSTPPASPYAKSLAAQQGVALAGVRGTGPGGRIIAADVLEAAAAPAAAVSAPVGASAKAAAPSGAAYIDLPNSNIRKVTAKRMVENKDAAPHYYQTMEIGMDALIAMRSSVNAAQDMKTSINDYVIKASALALKEVPECNSQWTDDYIRQFSAADISVAVSTERGLLTPIVFSADSKGILEVSSDMKGLVGKAKENKLKPDEFIGGTFTVSNLGATGIKQFTAIINGPQACILAVGGTEKKVVPNEGPNAASVPFVTKSVMLVTLSSDHRVVDGAIGSQWLLSFKKHMENPLLMLL